MQSLFWLRSNSWSPQCFTNQKKKKKKISRGSVSVTKNYARREKWGKGETEKQNCASRLSMISMWRKDALWGEGRKKWLCGREWCSSSKCLWEGRSKKAGESRQYTQWPFKSPWGTHWWRVFSNASCQLGICKIPLASNHSQAVVWSESAPSFFLMQSWS